MEIATTTADRARAFRDDDRAICCQPMTPKMAPITYMLIAYLDSWAVTNQAAASSTANDNSPFAKASRRRETIPNGPNAQGTSPIPPAPLKLAVWYVILNGRRRKAKGPLPMPPPFACTSSTSVCMTTGSTLLGVKTRSNTGGGG